jgi:hypothetical protein
MHQDNPGATDVLFLSFSLCLSLGSFLIIAPSSRRTKTTASTTRTTSWVSDDEREFEVTNKISNFGALNE